MTASASVVEVLRHYACSCEPGDCAMSADDTDVPVDDALCGRRAAEALAALTAPHPAREAVVQTLSDEFGKIETSEVVQRAADAILALPPQPAEQDAREAVARVSEMAGWFADGESGSHTLSHTVAAEHAADLRTLLALTQAAPDGWRPIETAPKDGTRVIGLLRNGRAVTMSCRKHHNGWVEKPGGGHVPNGILDDVWCEEEAGAFVPRNPAHWMPLLPAPPAQGAGS